MAVTPYGQPLKGLELGPEGENLFRSRDSETYRGGQ